MARNRLPGQHHKEIRVVAAVPGRTPESDDGQPIGDWTRATDLLQRITYVGDLERFNQRWSLVMQWVDLDNNGHRVAFPHEVVERLYRACEAIMKEARSDRSATGAATRAAKKADEEAQEFYEDEDGIVNIGAAND